MWQDSYLFSNYYWSGDNFCGKLYNNFFIFTSLLFPDFSFFMGSSSFWDPSFFMDSFFFYFPDSSFTDLSLLPSATSSVMDISVFMDSFPLWIFSSFMDFCLPSLLQKLIVKEKKVSLCFSRCFRVSRCFCSF